MKRALLTTPSFVRAARRYTSRNARAAAAIRATLQALSTDAFDPSLRTHKLKGGLSGSWSCSAGYDLRIIFDLIQSEGAEAILLLSVGTHDEVY